MGWLYQWTTTWHDAWDVVGAVATAAAVIVAVWGVRRESRARKLAEARADAAEQARVAERERVDRSGFNEFVDVAQVPVVPGGVRETAPVPGRVQQEQAREYGAVVDFRDLHGVLWRRTQDGKLFELDEHGNLK